MKNRILSLALAICMLLSAMPVSHAGILSSGGDDLPMQVEQPVEGGILSLGDAESVAEPVFEEQFQQGILSAGDGEEPQQEPSQSIFADDGETSYVEQPSEGILSITQPEGADEEPQFQPEDQPGHGLLVVQCGECGYLDNNHAKDCPVIAPAQPVITVPVATDEERKPAIVYSDSYMDTYAQLLSSETLEDFEDTLDLLTDDQQDELFELLTDDEQDALAELEDSLTRQAIADQPQKTTVKKIVTTEERTVAFGAAHRAALKQLGYELIVNFYGRIVEFVDMLASSYTVLETVTPAEDADYQWQILADDVWVDIQNETAPQIRVSYAMVASLLDRHDTVELRCEIDNDGDVTTTDPVEVYVEYDSDDVIIDARDSDEDESDEEELPEEEEEEETPAAEDDTLQLFDMPEMAEELDDSIMLMAEEGSENSGTQTSTKHTIVINYVFEDGTIAAGAYTAEVIAGNDFQQDVKSPSVQGHLPYIGTEPADTVSLNYPNVQQSYTITVTYKPTNVGYTVVYYLQDTLSNKYIEAEDERVTNLEALTGSVVGSNLSSDRYEAVFEKAFDGFYQLPYIMPTVAADGSTVVEIYYDRYYYLITFDLDGGYGTEPIYARYGSSLTSVVAPTRAGYTFGGWSLDGTDQVELPDTIPAENRTYKALWIPQDDSSFSVIYWLQNADPDKDTYGNVITDSSGNPVYGYSYWTSYEVTGQTPGQPINAESYKEIPATYANLLDQYERRYSKFSHTDGDTTVAGDNSSVVNVYYNRNTYTLKFYYAMSSGSGNTAEYYVVGGTTYYFGTYADNIGNFSDNDRADERKLFSLYAPENTYTTNNWTNPNSQTGEVETLPTLKDSVKSRYLNTYEVVTVGTKQYNFHYISFDAKYGADLSNLWPCNVFNSVTRTSKNTHGQWNKTEAFVSAWNGEYNVYYTQNNGNQTIKGNYNELDYQLLWETGDSDTVAYLCFWENGADVNWSVPELYRYHIYVRALPGQDTTGLSTREWKGNTYVLYKPAYDTVDNSSPANQTAPANRGFTYESYEYASISNFDENLYREAYNMYFYYSRDSYALQFRNIDTTADETFADTTVLFGDSLAEYIDKEPNAPATYESGSVVFAGWYTSPECAEGTEFEFTDDTTMPAGPLQLYAKWEAKEHTVRFFFTEKDYVDGNVLENATFQVSNGLTVDADEDVPDEQVEVLKNLKKGDATMIAWFYKDANGNERAFDIMNMPVKQDLDLYAKWDTGAFMDYVIYYQLESTGESVNEPEILAVADELNGFAHVGDTLTFEAKGGTDLYPKYQTGYFPKVKSHSITIAEDESTGEWYPTGPNGEREQSFTFLYVKKDAVPYKIQYVDKATGKPMSELFPTNPDIVTEIVADNVNAVVSKSFKPISGYIPDAYQKTLVITAEGEDKDLDGVVDDNVITFYYTQDNSRAYYKESHYIERIGGGWEEYTSETALGNINSIVTATPITIAGFTFNEHTEGTLMSGTVSLEGLHLKFYYTRNNYPYKVMYVDRTGAELIPSVIKDAPYESIISESPETIPYYTPVNSSAQTLAIRIETVDNLALNVVRFVYERVAAELTIKKTWNGDECYGQDAIFTIKGGELNGVLQVVIPYENDGESSTKITGLKAGYTYIVTEDGGWSWRFTPENASKSITLAASGNVLNFANKLNSNKIYWFDDSDHKRNLFGNPNN